MERSLAYTLNISSSSKSLEKSLSDTPATLYDRRERVPNICVSSHILSGLFKSSAFKDHDKEIISFHEESYLTTMVKEHLHVNVFVFIFYDAKEEKYDILVGCYLFYVLTKSRKREMCYV